MNLKNGYKVIYEKAENGSRVFYASETGECNPAVDFKIAIFKYEYKFTCDKDINIIAICTWINICIHVE